MEEGQATARLQEEMVESDIPVIGSSDNIYWVARESIKGRRFLDQLDLPGDAVTNMISLKDWNHAKISLTEQFVQHLLCKRQYIGIGRLEATPRRLEANQGTYHETQFRSVTKDERLSRAFSRPTSLADQPFCFEHSPSCKDQRTSDGTMMRERYSLFIGLELNRTRLAWFFVLWALIAVAVGLGTGFALQKVTIGIMVGGGFLAFSSILQGACVFAHSA